MGSAIFNIIFGIVCIVGGATGKLALIGTNSGPALAVVGAGVTGLGIYQLWRRQSRG